MKLGTWLVLFQHKFQQYLDELGEMGESTASTMFASAPGDDGNTDVTVTREYDSVDDARGFRIVASGHDAAFMEFGTGVETMVTRPTVQADFDISPGSWSTENDGPFSKQGYWIYNGVRMAGTPPIGAMQEACNAMEQWSSTIAGRIFG